MIRRIKSVVIRSLRMIIRKKNHSIIIDPNTNISLKTSMVCDKQSKIIIKRGVSTRGLAELRADNGGELIINENTFINVYCNICSKARIEIGKNVLIANGVTIVDHDHVIPINNLNDFVCGQVIIEDNVWIGSNVTVLKNVRIGKGSVIAAGAVVTKDVPAGVLVAGIPANIIRKFN